MYFWVVTWRICIQVLMAINRQSLGAHYYLPVGSLICPGLMRKGWNLNVWCLIEMLILQARYWGIWNKNICITLYMRFVSYHTHLTQSRDNQIATVVSIYIFVVFEVKLTFEKFRMQRALL